MASLCVGCRDTAAPSAVGFWGGPHVRLEVTNLDAPQAPSPGGTLEFDCAHGGLSESLVAGRDGRFSVAGWYVQEHGGPVRADQPLEARPARYAGWIASTQMTLMVTRTDTAWSAGPFTLVRGQQGAVFKCV